MTKSTVTGAGMQFKHLNGIAEQQVDIVELQMSIHAIRRTMTFNKAFSWPNHLK